MLKKSKYLFKLKVRIFKTNYVYRTEKRYINPKPLYSCISAPACLIIMGINDVNHFNVIKLSGFGFNLEFLKKIVMDMNINNNLHLLYNKLELQSYNTGFILDIVNKIITSTSLLMIPVLIILSCIIVSVIIALILCTIE
jgi:hypothetical protein